MLWFDPFGGTILHTWNSFKAAASPRASGVLAVLGLLRFLCSAVRLTAWVSGAVGTELTAELANHAKEGKAAQPLGVGFFGVDGEMSEMASLLGSFFARQTKSCANQ
jgi:hypothetical protein